MKGRAAMFGALRRPVMHQEVTALYRQVDFHTHSIYSPCGKPDALPSAIVQAAREKGIRKLGFSDHLFPSTNPAIFERIRADVAETPEGPELYFGCEADVVSPGKMTIDASLAATMDFVIAATTHYHLRHTERPPVGDPEACAAHYVAMFAYACETPYISIVAHPFHVPAGVFGCDPLACIRAEELQAPLQAARRNGVAIEIQPKNLDPERRDWYLRFYGLCKEMGVKFSFGSDAHTTANIGATTRLGDLVEALSITDEEVWLPQRRDH